jgi:hypothetical protein
VQKTGKEAQGGCGGLPQTVGDIQLLGTNPFVNFPENNYTALVNRIAQERELRDQERAALCQKPVQGYSAARRVESPLKDDGLMTIIMSAHKSAKEEDFYWLTK